MNKFEQKMVDHLSNMSEKYGVIGLKMEFEAEATRLEEAMRLKEVALRAGLSFTVKVGGCEAISDMYSAGLLGTDYLVGPMVETPYALRKFIQAVKLAYTPDQLEVMEYYINLETVTAIENFEKMLAVPEAKDLDGIVLGRVDLTGSMGLDRAHVNSSEVLDLCLKAASLAKSHGKKVIIGGAVSAASLPFFEKFPKNSLDKYETRKVVFGCPVALANKEEAFVKATEFELMWMQNKKEFYGRIFHEDDKRIAMLEDRLSKNKNSVTDSASSKQGTQAEVPLSTRA
jgi:4-hydroxy-2-oxoheptanedioate aldolase